MRLPHDTQPGTQSSVRQLTPADVRDLLADTPDGDVQLLDVREPWEYDIAHIPGSRLIPFALLPLKLRDLNPTVPIILICHHGIRSWHAACLLEQKGFSAVINVAGGIDAWSRTVDPGIPRY